MKFELVVAVSGVWLDPGNMSLTGWPRVIASVMDERIVIMRGPRYWP